MSAQAPLRSAAQLTQRAFDARSADGKAADESSESGRLRLELPLEAQQELLRASLAAWPREACGLLIGHDGPAMRRVTHMVPSPNKTPGEAGKTRFQLDPAAWIRAERLATGAGEKVLCTWHSHPGGGAAPSVLDWSGDPGFNWHVLVALPGIGPPSFWAWRRSEGQVQRVPVSYVRPSAGEFRALPDSVSGADGAAVEALRAHFPTRG